METRRASVAAQRHRTDADQLVKCSIPAMPRTSVLEIYDRHDDMQRRCLYSPGLRVHVEQKILRH